MSLLGNLRNKAVEAFVKNHELVKRFGDVQSISIDSDNGTADVSVLLHGEIFPIKFRGYYYFDDTDLGTDIVVRQALSYWLEGKTFRYTLPGLAGGLAKIIF